MSVAYNTKTINTNIVSCWDASNPKSYSVSNSWTDVVNKKVFTGSGVYSSNGYYTFNGTSAVHTIPAADTTLYDFTTGNYSIEAWINVTNMPASSYDTIITNTYLSGANVGWGLTIDSTSKLQFNTSRDNNKYPATSVTMATNTWYHVVASVSNTSLVLYQNSSQVLSTTITASTSISGSPSSRLAIGYMGLGGYFDGAIAMCKIYSTNLSALDVSNNFKAMRNRFNV